MDAGFGNQRVGVKMMVIRTPTSVNNNDDAGAQSILLEGDYNDISYNSITGAFAGSYERH